MISGLASGKFDLSVGNTRAVRRASSPRWMINKDRILIGIVAGLEFARSFVGSKRALRRRRQVKIQSPDHNVAGRTRSSKGLGVYL